MKLHPTRDLLLTVAILAAIPLFVSNSYISDVVIRIGLAAVALIGLNILMGLAGQISIGHAAFVAGAAYTSAILTSVYHWPTIAAIPAAAAAMTVLALPPRLSCRGILDTQPTSSFAAQLLATRARR